MHRFFLHLSLHSETCRSGMLLFLHLAQACKVLVAVELLSVREVGVPEQAAKKPMWVFVGVTTCKSWCELEIDMGKFYVDLCRGVSTN